MRIRIWSTLGHLVLLHAASLGLASAAGLAGGRPDVRFEVILARAEYAVGEPVLAMVCVENDSSSPVGIVRDQLTGHLASTIRMDLGGRELPFRLGERWSALGIWEPLDSEDAILRHLVVIKAGEHLTEIIPLVQHFSLDTTGTYTCICGLVWYELASISDGRMHLVATHEVAPVTANFTLTPGAPEDARAAEILRDDNSNAWQEPRAEVMEQIRRECPHTAVLAFMLGSFRKQGILARDVTDEEVRRAPFEYGDLLKLQMALSMIDPTGMKHHDPATVAAGRELLTEAHGDFISACHYRDDYVHWIEESEAGRASAINAAEAAGIHLPLP